VRFLLDVTAGARAAIERGELGADKAAAQLESKLREEPFRQFLSAPYVSVNKLATETPE